MEETVKQTALYLRPSFIKTMKKAAIDRDCSPSELVERAVLHFLENDPALAPLRGQMARSAS